MFMKLLLFTLFILVTNNAKSQSLIINDPSISLKCKALLKERQQSLSHKQKVRSLLERNRLALQDLSRERRLWREKILINRTELKKKLRLILLKIENQEEQIIRKGCPGIPLKTK